MTDRIRVAVVDDHPLMREGIIHILKADAAFDVVGEGANAQEALRIAQEQLPDIMLIDVSMPGGGIRAAEAIAETCPIVKVVMLTVSEDERDVSASLKAGARGYILKGVSGPEFQRSVRAIHNGENYVSPDLAARLLTALKAQPEASREPTTPPLLTVREEQILSLLADGLSNKEIAARLELSEKTIKHYMTNIFQKLQVRNRVEAALLARRSKED
ncbi:MAG: response regulator [Rhizobiales bacterium]|nr:response regulator [Hyphomicrobiales bacterium]